MYYLDSLIERISIERAKKVDELILGEITQIAEANGIDTRIVLNEKKIVIALRRQVPQKAKISLHGSTDWNTRCRCPACDKDLFDSQKYCSECGQRIDWGDKK